MDNFDFLRATRNALIIIINLFMLSAIVCLFVFGWLFMLKLLCAFLLFGIGIVLTFLICYWYEQQMYIDESNIKAYRQALNVRLKDLARYINISTSTLYKIENNKLNSPKLKQKIIESLKLIEQMKPIHTQTKNRS